jgi:hypothetical protein
MPRLDPQTVWRRLVEDKRLPCKARMEALEQIARPSVELLRRLLASKSTPSRLRAGSKEIRSGDVEEATECTTYK